MIPTLFSVSYAGLWGQQKLDLGKFIQKAAELGYSAVELMGKRPHLAPLDVTDQQLEDLRVAAKKNKIEIATLGAYTDFTSGRTATEVPFVEMQVAYVREMARLAKALGARIVRVFTGYTTDPEGAAADWDKCVKAVRECAELAQDFGVQVGVQNHHDIGVGTDSYVEFLDDVNHPNCKAMYDPWSPALHGDDLKACARRLAPRMIQTTLADYVKLKRYSYLPGLINYKPLPEMVRAVPLGDGFMDLPGFFEGLRDGGFKGYVAYEMCSPLRGGGGVENLDRTARKSLERMNQWIGGRKP
jgi:sugar phosphate isomerase/epimerase